MAFVTVSADVRAKEPVSTPLLVSDSGSIKGPLTVRGLWIKRMGVEITEDAAVFLP